MFSQCSVMFSGYYGGILIIGPQNCPECLRIWYDPRTYYIEWIRAEDIPLDRTGRFTLWKKNRWNQPYFLGLQPINIEKNIMLNLGDFSYNIHTNYTSKSIQTINPYLPAYELRSYLSNISIFYPVPQCPLANNPNVESAPLAQVEMATIFYPAP